MVTKQVTWANQHGKQLVHQKSIFPGGHSRQIPRRNPQKSIPSGNMPRFIRDRHIKMLKNIRKTVKVC